MATRLLLLARIAGRGRRVAKPKRAPPRQLGLLVQSLLAVGLVVDIHVEQPFQHAAIVVAPPLQIFRGQRRPDAAIHAKSPGLGVKRSICRGDAPGRRRLAAQRNRGMLEASLRQRQAAAANYPVHPDLHARLAEAARVLGDDALAVRHAALADELRSTFPSIGVTFLDQNQLPSI